LQSVTKVVAPWDSFFLPLQAIKNTIGAPRMAEPETFEAKCSETAPNRFYRILMKLVENKERISGLLPKAAHDMWERLIPYLEKIDEPDKILRDNKITLHEVFGPILDIKGPLRQYFDNEFLEKTEEYVSNNDLENWGDWIYRYNKSFILNTRAAVKLMDPLVIKDVKQVVKEYVPFVHDVGKIAMKKELPKVANEALAVLTHIVNPFDVLDAHGLSLKDLFEPLLADEKITKLMQPRWLSEIKALVEENNKEKFVNWLFSYTKKQIFGKETDSLAIALQKVVRLGKLLKVEAPRIFQKYKALPIMSKFKETIKDYKMPAKNSEFKIPTSSMRSRSLRGPATRSQARARTQKNRL